MSESNAAPQKVVLRDADGNVSEEVYLKDGALEGDALLYQAGKLRARIRYAGGKQSGEAVYFDDAGRATAKMNYADGKLEGESFYLDACGRTVRKESYRKGMLHGRTIDYYPSGKVRTVSHYRDNVLDGEVWEYGDDGKLRERRCYDLGKVRPCPRAANGSGARRSA
jgi:antitoxin component YwqK of YwqJK toxin-antitoxin module